MRPTNCLNCNGPLRETDEFCPGCGQTANLHRITLGHIFHDALHYFLHADKSAFTLVKLLATKTGAVASDYIAGRRKKYFAPLNFFLLVVGLVVLSMSVFHMFEHESSMNNQQLEAMAARVKDPVKKEMILTIMRRQTNAIHFIRSYSNFLSMLAAPLLALIYSLFYRNGRYNYAEHLTGVLYCVGFTSLVFGFITIPFMASGNQTVYYIAILAYFIFELTYRSVFYYRFIGNKGSGAAIKAFLVTLFSVLFWIVLTVAVVYWYISSGMSGLFH